MLLGSHHNRGDYKMKGEKRKVVTEKKTIKEQMYPSLCYQLLFWGLCVFMEQCRIGIFAPISISEQFGDPNYTNVFWQTEVGLKPKDFWELPWGLWQSISSTTDS